MLAAAFDRTQTAYPLRSSEVLCAVCHRTYASPVDLCYCVGGTSGLRPAVQPRLDKGFARPTKKLIVSVRMGDAYERS